MEVPRAGTTASGAGVSATTFEDIATSDRYRNARVRLTDRTATIAGRTVARLSDVQAEHDLTWRSLLASQRRIAQLDDVGSAPTPLEFWEMEAAPSSASLVTAAALVIESEMANAADAVSRFRASVEPLVADDRTATLVRADLDAVLQPLLRGVLDPDPLNAIGERWQRRLRRAATRRVIATRNHRKQSIGSDLLVDQEELVLLDRPPWAHGDRLLSAHEIAHNEIRGLVRDHLRELARITPRRQRHLDVVR